MTEPAWIPARTAKHIQGAVEAAEGALKDRLRAALLVGDALNPARADRAQHPELLIITSEPLSAIELRNFARAMHKPMHRGLRLRIVGERELRSGADVFALEVSEWQARHVLLAGKDVLGGITVEPNDLRRALERALRGLARRVRNRVLAALGTEGRRDDVAQALLDGVSRLEVLAHHGLELLGTEAPQEEDALIAAFAHRAGSDAGALVAQMDGYRSRGSIADPIAFLGALLPILDGCARLVDQLELEVP